MNSFEIFSLHDHTTLYYDCSIIADPLKHRMTGMSYSFHGVNITVAPYPSYPQYHDSHLWMCSYSNSSSAIAQPHGWGTWRWPLPVA
jgi:hypothetical protein